MSQPTGTPPRRHAGNTVPAAPARRRNGVLRNTAVALAVVLAAEAAAVIMTTGQAVAVTPEAPAPKPGKALGPAEAKDIATAHLKARLENRRIEVTDERGEATTTWVNPDGTTTLDLASGPVRFKDKDGSLRPIDVNLAQQADGSVKAKGHPLGLSLAGATAPAAASKFKAAGAPAGDQQAPAVPLVSLDNGNGNGTSMSLSWRGTLPAPVVDGTTARYQNALTATDLIIESTRTGFEQFLELKDRSAVGANGTVTMTLDAAGLRARHNADNSVSFLDPATGEEKGQLPAPVMWDAKVDARSGDHTHTAPVGLTVTQNGNAVDLTLTPDAAFLNDPATQYPVTVDPAVNIGVGFDTFVQQGYATDVSAQTELKLGNNGSGQVARSFLQFPMAKISGKQITGGKLNLWNFHSWSCTAKGWEVWDTGSATTSTRWTAQPGWNRKWATSTSTKGYSSSCNDGWVNQDITSLVQAWAGNGNANNTLGIRATDESDPYGWKKFNSGNASANTPYLSVTYNTPPAVSSLLAPANGALTGDATPTLSAKATDPDGGNVLLDFEVWAANGTAALQSGHTAYAASGSTFTWTPGTALPAGGYKWRSRSWDGTANSAWSAFRTFTVDTTAPGVTTIASGDFPAGQWAGTPDANGDYSGNFTLTPPTGDVKDVQYKLDGGSWVTAATTGTPVTAKLTFKAGAHTVTAHSRDAAGNVSADRTYTFSAGKGAALTAPGAGERAARRTTLLGEGNSNHTGVRYQYRRGETDTWKDVPVANVTTTDGKAVTGWPFAAPAGKPAPLTWNITDTLTADGPVDVQAVFTDGTSVAVTEATTITVDRNAGTAPDTEVGPGTVNTLTGDFGLSVTDAAGFGLSSERSFSSRRPGLGAEREGQAAIFGPQWSSSTVTELTQSDWAYVRQTSPTSVALVNGEGQETGFTATTGGGWKPEPGAEEYTLTGTLSGTFTLKSTAGATITFGKVDPAATTWQVTGSSLPADNSTTTVVSEKVAAGGRTLARPRYLVSPTSATASANCAAVPSTAGCRVLEYVYADTTTATTATVGDIAGQVKQIRLWSTAPGDIVATPVVIAEYRYDDLTRLREVWDPRVGPSAKTAYTYDAAGRVITLTPPGELPWTLTYGKAGNAATAGEGMLLAVSRPSLQQGSNDVTNGTAATNLVYDVPLTGTGAPYAMGVADVAGWGQSNAPTDATAFFPADAPPASHDGRALGAGDYAKAAITYTNASGRQVNTARAGGVTTTEYDALGNTTRELTADNRALALSTAGDGLTRLRALGLDKAGTADRATALSTLSTHSADGLRQLEQTGPLHIVALEHDLAAAGTSPARPAGDEVLARTHTVTAYDEGRPANAVVSNQPTSATVGARIDGYPADADARTTSTGYDWAKGLATQVVDDPTGLALTRNLAYDAQGRPVKLTQPKSNGSDVGTTVTGYWSATGTGACAGRPEWADLPCATGPAAPAADAGSNPAEIPTRTTEYDRWGNAAVVKETANGVTRTTTTTYDAAGRAVKTSVSGGTGTAVADTTTTYDAVTGRVLSVSNGSSTVTTGYDKLGRPVGYNDGSGNVTTTEYDVANRIVKESDSAPSTTTYTYDSAGRPQATTDSIAGTHTAEYDADGRIAKQTLPGGYVLTNTYNPQGVLTGKVYTGADGTVVLADLADYNVHGQQTGHTQSAGSAVESTFTYDANGRLTKAADKAPTGCTSRGYAFDKNSNRTSLTTSTEDCDPATNDVASTLVSSDHDSADRLKGAGYDAFGRITTHPRNGAQFGYYTTGLARSETVGTQRNTWALDAAGRPAARTSETQAGDGTWSTTAGAVNHYGCGCDSPTWSKGDSGEIVRLVTDLTDTLSAVTGATGGTVLQLTNLHGDVSVQLPLDPAESLVVRTYDEYGNLLADLSTPATPATGYGWIGGQQRDSATLSGVVLMGSRLYDPTLGRFLQTDSVLGGNANAYAYPTDPVNMFDLDGRWSWSKTRYYSWGRATAYVSASIGWHGLKYKLGLKIVFNRSYTAKIGRSAHYFWGPLAAAMALFGPVGAALGVVTAAKLGWIQKTAAKANHYRKCVAVKFEARGLTLGLGETWVSSC
ncbi:DNRLRE domain-containing protein [Kitasatospora purpeofusca]|uniref:DNRLRE domain-containing protein n=1 Tax=Kitasatospora purpeofusca TaxID=67352 RepID=A0ABZ1U991_9ACTN|nr:DNRLRE domain-containing protein [Kitasatospora purpeofusca]